MTFPTEPAQVSDAWLTSVLRASGVRDAVVIRHEWRPVALAGATGTVGQVHLWHETPAADAPASIVIKFAVPHPPIRAVMHRFGFYRNEVEFYRQIGADAGIPTPRCYAADIDHDSGHFVIVLEDMSAGRVGDGAAPRVEDVEMAVDHLAPFHARWWNDPRLRELSWLTFPDSPAFQVRVAAVQQSFGGAVQAVGQKLGPRFPAVLGEAARRMLADWPGYIRSRVVTPPTLVHRDFHPQQIFFPSERGGRFAVFDWQTSGIGAGAEDLARIVAMGLTTTQRAAHDGTLIERYHASLQAHGVAGYSLDACRDDFRLGLAASLITNVVAAANIDFDALAAREAETGVSLVYAIFDRLAAAFDAHDVLGRLPAA